MAVVEVLFEVGKPQNVLPESVCGPDVPNKYSVGNNTVEFMPHWGYYTVANNGRREHVSLRSTQEDPVLSLRNKLAPLQEKS